VRRGHPKSIDRLVVVPNGEHTSSGVGHEAHELEVCFVQVLVLVD
jgi:hypothetical protein